MKDRKLGLISICLGSLIAAYTYFGISSKIIIENDPGAKVFPYVLSIMMMVIGICLCLRKNEVKEEQKDFLKREEWVRLIKLFSALCFYVAMLWLVGFIASTIIALIILCMLFSQGKVSKIKAVIYAVVATVVIYTLFRFALQVYLPTGVLLSLF